MPFAVYFWNGEISDLFISNLCKSLFTQKLKRKARRLKKKEDELKEKKEEDEVRKEEEPVEEEPPIVTPRLLQLRRSLPTLQPAEEVLARFSDDGWYYRG